MVPDSPWKIWMIEPASSFTWSGASAEKRGWKPSNTAVRFERRCGSRHRDDTAGIQGLAAGRTGKDAQETLAQQVLEVDRGLRVGGEVLGVSTLNAYVWRGCRQASPRSPCPPRLRRSARCLPAGVLRRWRIPR